jgi:Ca2+-transporting ATPase
MSSPGNRPDKEPTGVANRNPAWHSLTATEVARQLRTDPERGLDQPEAEARLKVHGPNALRHRHGRSAWLIFLVQFHSLMVGLLVVAALLAFVTGENLEGAAILVVIVLNALFGFLTEWKAESALAALHKQIVPVAHVVRSGEERQIEAEGLVPGDIVILAAGSRVPADGRILEAARLQTDEATLTGESTAASKQIEPVDDADAMPADRTCMAFLGTTATEGRGRMIVTATGSATQMGHIGALIEEGQSDETPLERKLTQLGHTLIWIVLTLCGVIVLCGWLRGNPFWQMLEVGISLAIAAVPEGLPAVATMTLAIGMQRMARRNALVRRLPAVETLGSTTVICSDKTGTLTRNEMTVSAYHLGDRLIEVTGSGYTATGAFLEGRRHLDAGADSVLTTALRIGALCGDATLDEVDGETVVLGDPTEGALIVAAAKAGLSHEQLEHLYPRLGEVPFTSETKRMTTIHRTPERKCLAYIKGAPSVLLDSSRHQLTPEGVFPLIPENRQKLQAANEELAGRALRVLALAYKEVGAEWRDEHLEGDLVFVGLVGMIDPLREEAKAAIATCKQAGIRTIMITGDQLATAREIARQLGLDRDPEGHLTRAVHGKELKHLDADGWRRLAGEASVFARVSPEHKLRIVEALQEQGEIVAMTGDGVNDAPALQKADIGVAMGIKGTEVAKEASDMIILDDNFASIVAAVDQGRIIYSNILRFIHFLFSCNLAEILVVFLALLLGWPLPLAALQILWLNMITDVFPALALAVEPSSPDTMRRPPRNPREPLVSLPFLGLIAWQGAILAGMTLIAFRLAMAWHGTEGAGLDRAVTVAFMTMALAQVFHAFNARSRVRSAFDRQFFSNGWLWTAVVVCLFLQLAAVQLPFLRMVLRTAPLGPGDWALVFGCSLAPVLLVELTKLARPIGSFAHQPGRPSGNA